MAIMMVIFTAVKGSLYLQGNLLPPFYFTMWAICIRDTAKTHTDGGLQNQESLLIVYRFLTGIYQTGRPPSCCLVILGGKNGFSQSPDISFVTAV